VRFLTDEVSGNILEFFPQFISARFIVILFFVSFNIHNHFTTKRQCTQLRAKRSKEMLQILFHKNNLVLLN